MLLPLGVGLFIRARHQAMAAIDTIGTGGIPAALILLVVAFGGGFALAGGPEAQRSVPGLGTAQRNLSAAIVAAAQNFGDDPEVITMVMVVGVLGLILLFAAAGELGRRADARTGAAPHAAPVGTGS
jgi:BASS family bile acid:Na+ symporter